MGIGRFEDKRNTGWRAPRTAPRLWGRRGDLVYAGRRHLTSCRTAKCAGSARSTVRRRTPVPHKDRSPRQETGVEGFSFLGRGMVSTYSTRLSRFVGISAGSTKKRADTHESFRRYPFPLWIADFFAERFLFVRNERHCECKQAHGVLHARAQQPVCFRQMRGGVWYSSNSVSSVRRKTTVRKALMPGRMTSAWALLHAHKGPALNRLLPIAGRRPTVRACSLQPDGRPC